MHSLRGKRGLIGGLIFALAAAVALPVPAHAGPDPAAKRQNTGRYRLFAGNLGAITINRVYYGLNTRGEVGVDSLNSSTIGGGFWPKGTGNQYMFNSGLQVAGVIRGEKPNNPWANDTTGGMFFDASGLRQHGTNVTEMYNATSPTDVANWPQAAYVPVGDASEELFAPLLRGRVSASQGDVWFMSSEADPALNNARSHPLGIVAEYRVMGWNYPTGNEDLLYLILTFYNITSRNAADYAHYRPGLREILIEEAEKFHSLNNAQFNVTLPQEGYTIDPFYAAFAADPDVTDDAGQNFSSVNMPFAMGYAYHANFERAAGWTFSPDIFGPPFFAGSGFVGIKYLKSATGPGEIALFSNTQNGGTNFPDPNSAIRLFKYLSGTVTPADGVACNSGNVEITRICYIKSDSPADMRLVQSSSPVALEAGQSASIVVSYIHAAPVAIPGYVQGDLVLPGDPVRLSNWSLLTDGGANRVDSIMGFLGYEDSNNDSIVQENEFRVVPGSLLDKASVAQAIFNSAFLLPFAPDAPDFFLIPGNMQVSVVWRPTRSETEGDPFFQVAKDAMTVPPGGGEPVVNPLYDPNYRNFDVEGYRIYRGRSDTPTGLKLIAQFDYTGTSFSDYTGQFVHPDRGARCAPELGVIESCDGDFDNPEPGLQLEKHIDYDLSGNIVQSARGARTLLASGDVIYLSTDTAVTGRNTGFPGLSNTGVPFVYIDDEVQNGLTYYYAVTAFDINSINSTGAGNTSLESARITKRVSPRVGPGNLTGATIQAGMFGRGGLLTDKEFPKADPATGKLNKKFPPSDAVSLSLAGFVGELLPGPGEISLSLDSIRITGYAAASSITALFNYTLSSPLGETKLALSRSMSSLAGITSTSGSFPALVADPAQAAKYGAPAGEYGISGSYTIRYPGLYYTGVRSRGCLNADAGFITAGSCNYNGPRWFAGENETMDHPNSSNPGRWNTGLSRENFNNVGELPGVTTIYEPRSYDDYTSGSWRDAEAMMGVFAGGADYKVYWGAGGVVDSVIDVTHDVVVPFNTEVNASWGILNASATGTTGYPDQRAELSVSDMSCVHPLRAITSLGCTAAVAQLSNTAVPGAVVYGATASGGTSSSGSTNTERTAPVAAGQGFVFYLKGHPFLIELAGGLPEAGTVWTMRDFVGVVRGGTGRAGSYGAYAFNRGTDADHPTPQPAHFSAIGATAKYAFDIDNTPNPSTKETLAKVHTVPDPYYVTSSFEATTSAKQIKFVNLPASATIRIYTTSGVLVRALRHETTAPSGELTWDVRNRNNQFVASGVYFYHVTAENGETHVGRMTIINYAQ